MSRPTLKNKLWVFYFQINALLSIMAALSVAGLVGYYVYCNSFEALKDLIIQKNIEMWNKDNITYTFGFVIGLCSISLICSNLISSIAVFNALQDEADKKHHVDDKDVKSKAETKK